MTKTLMNSCFSDLLLARLLVPSKRGLTRADLKNSLEPFFAHRETSTDLSAHLDQQLEVLATAGLIRPKPLALTESGRAKALIFLGTDSLPARANWKTIRNMFLLPKAIGLTEQVAEVRKRLSTADGLRAALLSREHALAIGPTPTLSQALNALAWKQFGVDSAEPFTLQAVLARALGLEGKVSRERVGKVLPVKAVGARNSNPDELRQAAIRRWLDGSVQPDQVPERNGGQAAFNLGGFAEAVLEAARSVPTGRFGDHKVFISHIGAGSRSGVPFPQ